MRKNLFYFFAVICAMSLLTTACSKDDDEDTSWKWIEGTYQNDSLSVTLNGVEQPSSKSVKLTASSATKATLKFSKLEGVADNISIDVTYSLNGAWCQFSGSKEKETGYMIVVGGDLKEGKLTVTVTTSGYALVSKSYTTTKLNLTYNGEIPVSGLDAPVVKFDASSNEKADITLYNTVPGMYFPDDNNKDKGLVFEEAPIVKAADSESYSFTGTTTYESSTITISGTISTKGIMTIAVDQKIVSNIVGIWNVRKDGALTDVIFNLATPSGTVILPDDFLSRLPEDIVPLFKKEMTDRSLSDVMKNLLGEYMATLQAIEFKDNGSIVVTTLKDGQTQSVTNVVNYIIEEGKVSIAPNYGTLMQPKSRSTVTYDLGNLLMGAGIPFTFNGSNRLYMDTDITKTLLSLSGGLLLALGPDGMNIFNRETYDLLLSLSTSVSEIASGCTQLELGLNISK